MIVMCNLTDGMELIITDDGSYAIRPIHLGEKCVGHLVKNPMKLADSIRYAYDQLKIHEPKK